MSEKRSKSERLASTPKEPAIPEEQRRSVAEILETGAARVTETELERLCEAAMEAKALREALEDATAFRNRDALNRARELLGKEPLSGPSSVFL
jgi:predicted phage gp36 major capsid-like protein